MNKEFIMKNRRINFEDFKNAILLEEETAEAVRTMAVEKKRNNRNGNSSNDRGQRKKGSQETPWVGGLFWALSEREPKKKNLYEVNAYYALLRKNKNSMDEGQEQVKRNIYESDFKRFIELNIFSKIEKTGKNLDPFRFPTKPEFVQNHQRSAVYDLYRYRFQFEMDKKQTTEFSKELDKNIAKFKKDKGIYVCYQIDGKSPNQSANDAVRKMADNPDKEDAWQYAKRRFTELNDMKTIDFLQNFGGEGLLGAYIAKCGLSLIDKGIKALNRVEVKWNEEYIKQAIDKFDYNGNLVIEFDKMFHNAKELRKKKVKLIVTPNPSDAVESPDECVNDNNDIELKPKITDRHEQNFTLTVTVQSDKMELLDTKTFDIVVSVTENPWIPKWKTDKLNDWPKSPITLKNIDVWELKLTDFISNVKGGTENGRTTPDLRIRPTFTNCKADVDEDGLFTIAPEKWDSTIEGKLEFLDTNKAPIADQTKELKFIVVKQPIWIPKKLDENGEIRVDCKNIEDNIDLKEYIENWNDSISINYEFDQTKGLIQMKASENTPKRMGDPGETSAQIRVVKDPFIARLTLSTVKSRLPIGNPIQFVFSVNNKNKPLWKEGKKWPDDKVIILKNLNPQTITLTDYIDNINQIKVKPDFPNCKVEEKDGILKITPEKWNIKIEGKIDFLNENGQSIEGETKITNFEIVPMPEWDTAKCGNPIKADEKHSIMLYFKRMMKDGTYNDTVQFVYEYDNSKFKEISITNEAKAKGNANESVIHAYLNEGVKEAEIRAGITCDDGATIVGNPVVFRVVDEGGQGNTGSEEGDSKDKDKDAADKEKSDNANNTPAANGNEKPSDNTGAQTTDSSKTSVTKSDNDMQSSDSSTTSSDNEETKDKEMAQVNSSMDEINKLVNLYTKLWK